jgi:hypothetical protein
MPDQPPLEVRDDDDDLTTVPADLQTEKQDATSGEDTAVDNPSGSEEEDTAASQD